MKTVEKTATAKSKAPALSKEVSDEMREAAFRQAAATGKFPSTVRSLTHTVMDLLYTCRQAPAHGREGPTKENTIGGTISSRTGSE